MYTFLIALIAFIISIYSVYLYLKSSLKGMLFEAISPKIFLGIIVADFIMVLLFILSTVAPSEYYADVFLHFAIYTLRLDLVLIFIFSEIVRDAKHMIGRVLGISSVFGASIVTYSFSHSEFVRIGAFWERISFHGFIYAGIDIDLILVVTLVVAVIYSSVMLALKSFFISDQRKRQIAYRYYTSGIIVLLGSILIFLVNKVLWNLTFVYSAVLLLAVSILLAIHSINIKRYPYHLYIGSAKLLGIIIIDAESGLLIYQKKLNSTASLVSGAFWAIISIFERELNKRPKIISMDDSLAIVTYYGNLIGVFLFDRLIDILPILTKLALKEIAQVLREEGVVSGILKDYEVREKVEKIIDQTLDPFFV